jgi:hypothetical protein
VSSLKLSQQNFVCVSHLLCTCPNHFIILLRLPFNFLRKRKLFIFSLHSYFQLSLTYFHSILCPNILLVTMFSNTLYVYVFLSVWDKISHRNVIHTPRAVFHLHYVFCLLGTSCSRNALSTFLMFLSLEKEATFSTKVEKSRRQVLFFITQTDSMKCWKCTYSYGFE